MSATTLDVESIPRAADARPAPRLRQGCAAARLAFTWFGTRKTLTAEQKAEAADAFGAEGQFLSAGKKLLDTRHPRFKAVTAVKHQAVEYWRSVSLPFPEPGIRLVRQETLEEFDTRMTGFRNDLRDRVADLDRHFDGLKNAARERLGRLYDPRDYPATLVGLFDLSWDYPSVQAPEYLRELSPDLYRQECRRVQARFEEAVRLAEGAFVEELAKLVSHLSERLSGSEDGRPKVFRDSAVGNLREFFERFKSLSVGSSAELDRLVEQCQGVLGGVQPQQLRDSAALRQQVVGTLAGVQASLDGMLVDRPRRRLLRDPKGGPGDAVAG